MRYTGLLAERLTPEMQDAGSLEKPTGDGQPEIKTSDPDESRTDSRLQSPREGEIPGVADASGRGP